MAIHIENELFLDITIYGRTIVLVFMVYLYVKLYSVIIFTIFW
jgi:hypothetical protein